MRKPLNRDEVLAATFTDVKMGMVAPRQPEKETKAPKKEEGAQSGNETSHESAAKIKTAPIGNVDKLQTIKHAQKTPRDGTLTPVTWETRDVETINTLTGLPSGLPVDLIETLTAMPYDTDLLLKVINDHMSVMTLAARLDMRPPRRASGRAFGGVTRRASVKVPKPFVAAFREKFDPLNAVNIRKIAEQWFELHFEQAARDLLEKGRS